jgi:hypothetical protein
MIDKVETPFETGEPLTKEAFEVKAELRSVRPAIPFVRSRDYQARVDLRRVMKNSKGEPLDGMLHIHSKNGNHTDKLEVLNCGDKSWDEICDVIGCVTQRNPEELRTRRLDLCTDTDVPVPWYARSVRAQWKRWRTEVGEIELYSDVEEKHSMQFMDIGKRRLETMYLGRQPNLIRIYDKTAERLHRYHYEERQHYRAAMVLDDSIQARRKVYQECGFNISDRVTNVRYLFDKTIDNPKVRSKALQAVKLLHPFPSFNDWSNGRLWDFTTLTRLERQMQGKLPIMLSTVEAVRNNVLDFNPFEKLNFAAPPNEPKWEEIMGFTFMERMAGLMCWRALTEDGITYDELYKNAAVGKFGRRANAKTTMKRLEPFLAKAMQPTGGERTITAEELYEQYRSSIKRQLQIAA